MFINMLTSVSQSTSYVFAKHVINTIWYSGANVRWYSVKSVFCRKGKENTNNSTLTIFETKLRHRFYNLTKKRHHRNCFSVNFIIFFFRTAILENTLTGYFWVFTNITKVLTHSRQRLPTFKTIYPIFKTKSASLVLVFVCLKPTYS